MDNEMVDILDENGNPTGEVKLKREAHDKGLWHRAVHVWIYTFKGKILLQKRAKQKTYLPGLMDVSVGGHVSAGESFEEAAVKEIGEELGIKANASELKKIETKKIAHDIPETGIFNHEIIQVYLLRLDKKLKDFKLQKEEVESIRLISLEKFESEIKDPEKLKHYTPFGDYFFEIIGFIKEDMKRIS